MVGLTFKSKTAPLFFLCKVVVWAEPRKVVSCGRVGPYLQPPQKPPELCSISLQKMGFQSCDSWPVLQCMQGLLYAAVKPMTMLLLCKTSNGAKRPMLTGVTVSSDVAPEVSCVGHSHPLHFILLQFNTDCYQAVTYCVPSCFLQLNFANCIYFPV